MPTKTTHPSEDLSNPYGYSEMDWAAQLDPAYAAARAEVRRLSVGEEGTLSVKVKELIVLGILASRGLQYGVEAHMRRAPATAPPKRVIRGHQAAAVPGGGVAYGVGVRALQALEQAGVFAPPTAPSRARQAEHRHCIASLAATRHASTGYRRRAGQPTLTDHPPAGHRCDTPEIASLCRWNRAKALTPRGNLCTLSLGNGSWRAARDDALPQRRWV